jgi:hypothetical protein
MISPEALRRIAAYGACFREELLRYIRDGENARHEVVPARLASDWWEATQFFFSHACYQGRRDQVSDKVYDAVIGVLRNEYGGTDRDAKFEAHRDTGWTAIDYALRKVVGKGYIGKSGDVRMVLSYLRYISRLPDKNIVREAVDQIARENIEPYYRALQASKSPDGITQVGDKVAAFYLRDVVSLFDLESYVGGRLGLCVQPVDVWVRRVCKQLSLVDPKIPEEKLSDEEIRSAIISACEAAAISPLSFNQGAWFMGSNAFRLLLEQITDGTKSP